MLEEKAKRQIKIGRYRHHKGKEYQVLEIAKRKEDGEELVIYRQLYGDKSVWVRPINNFLEEFKSEGKLLKRFELIKEEKNDSFEDKYKRALADYQNLLKQTVQEKQEFAKYANEGIIRDIIPVYNNLKISIKHIGDTQDQWVIGVKHVLKQFKDALENSGLKEIETENEKFDPEKMEAIEGAGDSVKAEVSPGYILNGRVIEPARVIVESKDDK